MLNCWGGPGLERNIILKGEYKGETIWELTPLHFDYNYMGDKEECEEVKFVAIEETIVDRQIEVSIEIEGVSTTETQPHSYRIGQNGAKIIEADLNYVFLASINARWFLYFSMSSSI